MTPNLESAVFKFNRALFHLNEINRLLESLANDAAVKQARAEPQFDEKRGCWLFIARNLVRFPAAASPLLGDYFHNLRSALDHLAFQLFLDAGGDPLSKGAKDVQFPIYGLRGDRKGQGDKAGFRGNVRRRLPLPFMSRTVIEGYQPYPRRKGLRPLALLANLSNDDKHRAVTPIQANAVTFTLHSVGAYGGRITRFVPKIRPGQAIEDGAELVRVWLSPAKTKPVMNADLTTVVSLESGDPLGPTLYDMYRLVAEILIAFGADLPPLPP